MCIYCGRADLPLTDEHIVPYAIGGRHVLTKASCKECAKITSRIERTVARGMWGDARISYDAPSRRKKRRPTHVVLDDPRAPGRRLKVKRDEYPAPMIFYEMQPAGILQGWTKDVDISGAWRLTSIMDDRRKEEFLKKHPGDLIGRFHHHPNEFGRLLAKIGYCHVMRFLDRGDVNTICLPFILGAERNVSFVVGGVGDIPKPNEGVGYGMTINFLKDETFALVVVAIRLVAHAHTPIYHAVVGYSHGSDQVGRVRTKLSGDPALVVTDVRKHESARPKAHWMPRVWPPRYLD